MTQQSSLSTLPVSIAALIPYARNARTHSEEQVAQIAASLIEFGWTNPILIDGNRGVIAGHGRLMAARKVRDAGAIIPNWPDTDAVPTIELAHLTQAQRRAYIIADNQLATRAGWDAELLAVELDELRDLDFDLSVLGFEAADLNDLIGTPNIGPDPLAERAEAARTLADRFMIPPFSVFNAREGWWQARKKAWIALGIRSELGRGGGAATPPHPPTVTQNADGTLNYGGTAGQAQRFDRQRQPDSRGVSYGDAAGQPQPETGADVYQPLPSGPGSGGMVAGLLARNEKAKAAKAKKQSAAAVGGADMGRLAAHHVAGAELLPRQGGAAPGGSPRPAADYSPARGHKEARGAGNGRPL